MADAVVAAQRELALACVRQSPVFFARHHLDSYEDFLSRGLPGVVAEFNPAFVLRKTKDLTQGITRSSEFRVTVSRVRYLPPVVSVEGGPNQPLLPNVARVTQADYALEAVADITIDARDTDTGEAFKTELPAVRLARIPLMLRSSRCSLAGRDEAGLVEAGEDPRDPGGYFVQQGRELVLVPQEVPALNRASVYEFSEDEGTTVVGTELLFGSAPPDNMFSPYILKLRRRDRAAAGLSFKHQPLDSRAVLPLGALFRALGVRTDRDVARHVLGKEVPRDCSPAALARGGHGLDARDMLVLDELRPTLVEYARLAAEGGFPVTDRLAAVSLLAEHTREGMRERQARRRMGRRAGAEAADAPLRDGMAVVETLLRTELLRGCGESLAAKATQLGALTRELLLVVVGLEPVTERDCYITKRLQLAGPLLSSIFREAYRKFMRQSLMVMDSAFNYGPAKSSGNIGELVTPDKATGVFNHLVITEVFYASFRGDWGKHADNIYKKVETTDESSIVLEMERRSWMGFLSDLRSVRNPLDASTRGPSAVRARLLHGSQYGVLCPIESPDGKNIGLLNHLSLLCHVTNQAPVAPALAAIEAAGATPADRVLPHELRIPGRYRVVVNGTMTHVTDGAVAFVAALRAARRRGELDRMTAVVLRVAAREVAVGTDGGRCCRPLLLAGGPGGGGPERAAARLRAAGGDWRALLGGDEPAVEYLDAEELWSRAVVAFSPELATPETTHLEVHPAAVLSTFCANAVLPQHNQSPRNILTAQFSKHAASLYSHPHRFRFDSEAKVLARPQLPLVASFLERAVGADSHPNGENVVVAIMCLDGYNMEDAVIINRAAVDRGLLSITVYTNMRSIDEDGATGSIRTGAVPTSLSQAAGPDAYKRFSSLDETGLPHRDHVLREGDVLLGRVVATGTGRPAPAADTVGASPLQSMLQAIRKERDGIDPSRGGSREARDVSRAADERMRGLVVDRALDSSLIARRTGGDANERNVVVRYRHTRGLQPGDKVASRHGQKGVVGIMLPPEDMPFDRDGVVPDIIFNPHGIPSRMTISHLMEHVFSKAACFEGRRYNGTPLEDAAPESAAAAAALRAAGRHPAAEEVLRDGKAGEDMGTSAFVGPCYYQRLRQMTFDKLQFRGNQGPIDDLTHQPVKGRARGGAIRLGEMERDALLSHGVASTLKEAFMEKSDKTHLWLDSEGEPARVANNSTGSFLSSAEGDPREFGVAELPRTFIVLKHELEALGSRVRLMFDPPAEEDTEDDDAWTSRLDEDAP